MKTRGGVLPRAAAGDGAAACVQVRVLPSLPPSLPLCVPLSVSASAGLSPDLPLPSSALGAFQSRKPGCLQRDVSCGAADAGSVCAQDVAPERVQGAA